MADCSGHGEVVVADWRDISGHGEVVVADWRDSSGHGEAVVSDWRGMVRQWCQTGETAVAMVR